MMLLRDYGTHAARRGTQPCDRLCASMVIRWSSAPMRRSRLVQDLFREHWPTSAAIYLPGGRVPETGTLVHRTGLSPPPIRACLKEAESAGGDRVVQIERARKVWSQGFVAEAIDRFCRTQEIMDVSGERHRGVLTRKRHGELAGARRGRR